MSRKNISIDGYIKNPDSIKDKETADYILEEIMIAAVAGIAEYILKKGYIDCVRSNSKFAIKQQIENLYEDKRIRENTFLALVALEKCDEKGYVDLVDIWKLLLTNACKLLNELRVKVYIVGQYKDTNKTEVSREMAAVRIQDAKNEIITLFCLFNYAMSIDELLKLIYSYEFSGYIA